MMRHRQLHKNQVVRAILPAFVVISLLFFVSPSRVSAQDSPPKSQAHEDADEHDHDHEKGPKSLGHLLEDETLHPRFAKGPGQVWRNGLPVAAASLLLLALRSKRGKT